MKNRTAFLRAKAEAARKKAIAPYSGFAVGAVAAGTKNGRLVHAIGANIEVGSSAAGICAERVAISALLMKGVKPEVVCITADSESITPCGQCLQFMQEWEPMVITPLTGGLPLKYFLPFPYRGRKRST